MTWLYSPTFLPYTVVAVTSELAGYEGAKIAVLDNHPYVRSWRSNNSLTLQSFLLDVGAPIVDAGFESSIPGSPPQLSASWANVFGTPVAPDAATADTTIKAHGTYSMKLVCASGNTFGRQQIVNVVPGMQYTLRVAIRMTARAAGKLNVDVYYLPSGLETDGIQITTTSGSFTVYTDLATMPAGCTQVAVRVFGDGTPNFTAYIDDIALVPKIGAIGIFNTNSPTISLATGDDGVNFSFLTGSPFTMTSGGNFYRACLVQTVPLDHRYVALLTADTTRTTNSASYYELGCVWFAPPLIPFPKAPAKDLKERLFREYDRSGESVSPAGPWRFEHEAQLVAPTAATIPVLRTFALTGQDQTFLLYEGNGLLHQTYLMRMTDDLIFQRVPQDRYTIVNPRWREVV